MHLQDETLQILAESFAGGNTDKSQQLLKIASVPQVHNTCMQRKHAIPAA